MPICSWCGQGTGRRYTKNKGVTYYYRCHKCEMDYKHNSDELKEGAEKG